MTREQGYYWVVKRGERMIANWHSSGDDYAWSICGSSICFEDSAFEQIDQTSINSGLKL